MTRAEGWQLVRDLFERALEEGPPDLDAWLDGQAIADPEMRDEVRSLLGHHSKAGSFLLEPVANRLPDLLDEDGGLGPGQVVGPYAIERELGRGGMGRVYLAADRRLGRRVALKALSPALTADPSHRERLRREARAAAALTHPGICTVYALEEIDGDLFIAAEFIDGRTMREEIESGRRPAAGDVVRTAAELAAALASAHERGITHRDLKPENVMRTKDGRLKILDFGLARMEALPAGWGHTTASPGAPSPWPQTAAGPVTQPGVIVGTPAYMAPEQLNGEAVDARADVFALGVLMYEYACGTHPFQAASPLAVVARILESEAAPIGRWRSDLPSGFAVLLDRCFQKSPSARFASAGEIVRALDRVETGRPSGEAVRWWRVHQVVAIALYFLACGLAWQNHRWQPGMSTALFVLTSVAATVGGVFRGHLLFTEGVTTSRLGVERRRATPVTLVSDVLVALALAVDGVSLVATRAVVGVLTVALGVGIALTRLVVEPATTAASFPPEQDG